MVGGGGNNLYKSWLKVTVDWQNCCDNDDDYDDVNDDDKL